jgi:hypothetical protein
MKPSPECINEEKEKLFVIRFDIHWFSYISYTMIYFNTVNIKIHLLHESKPKLHVNIL